MAYCKKLTKEYLIKLGIENVTEDGKVFGIRNRMKGAELVQVINNSGYFCINRNYLDENDQLVKIYPDKSKPYYYTYKHILIPVQRVVYAWFNGEVPEGMVVDHINDDKSDNRLCNLQLKTPKENINKHKKYLRVKKVKKLEAIVCYDANIYWRTNYYELAKQSKDEKGAHALRSQISNLMAVRTYAELVLMLGLESPKLAEIVANKKISIDEYEKIMDGEYDGETNRA